MQYRLELNSKITVGSAGVSLLNFLAERFTYHDRAFWQEKISGGEVLLNGQLSSPERVLAVGDRVSFALENFVEPDLDTNYQKIWENENLLLVSKPADLPVHSNRRFFYQTMTAILRREECLDQLNPVHRLDRESSGLMLYLKKPLAEKSLRRYPGRLIVGKFYLVLVRGVFLPSELKVNEPLREAGCPPVRYQMVVSPDGKPSSTVFYRIAVTSDSSLLLARLETGRKHQIRAHLAHIGHPVVGDKLYADDGRCFIKRCHDEMSEEDLLATGAPHQLLHSWALALQLPQEPVRLFFSDHFSQAWQSCLKKFTTWREKALQVVNSLIEIA